MKSLSPAHLAVLIIDVQVGLFRTKPPPFEAAEVISRINSVTAKARAARALVIFVQHDFRIDRTEIME
jgi:nicotinamidase-related amidase